MAQPNNPYEQQRDYRQSHGAYGYGYGQQGQPGNPYNQNSYLHMDGQQQFLQQPPYTMGYQQGVQKPDNQMLWTILSVLFSVGVCMPFAIFGAIGMYFSSQVDKHWRMGFVDEAQRASRQAKRFAIIGVLLSIAVPVLYFVWIFTMIITQDSSSNIY
ncbi:CD225/dispanin family protein [Corynebacterium freiburgense]|uniref:CD225/dispanin family protein n=1 Tax=Corynebacterium freiburgense TaxID=556548 RepID=UPI000685D075|nr:CD225/dispanin family protein [Corynebacterium freiburgense]WJZ03949.1 Interferon-induced transmembrane protein [Corynebacterium freiburgense]